MVYSVTYKGTGIGDGGTAANIDEVVTEVAEVAKGNGATIYCYIAGEPCEVKIATDEEKKG